MDKIEKVLKAIEVLKVVFPPPRNRSDYAEQIALFDLYEAADAVTEQETTTAEPGYTQYTGYRP